MRSEEIVHERELMDYDTGVDLERLLAASRRLRALSGHEISSQIVNAGRFRCDSQARSDANGQAESMIRANPTRAEVDANSPAACYFPDF